MVMVFVFIITHHAYTQYAIIVVIVTIVVIVVVVDSMSIFIVHKHVLIHYIEHILTL